MATKQLDLRLLDYVNECDENLECAICRCPFIEPRLLHGCGHCFCQDCIHQAWSSPDEAGHPTSGKCPTCRYPTHVTPYAEAALKIFINVLDDLLVRCPNLVDGCTAVIKRAEAQDHVHLYCGYEPETCRAYGCEHPVRRKDLELGCLHYDVNCSDCGQQTHQADLESHQKLSCPQRTIKCSRCEADLVGREVEDHDKNACPGAKLSCPGVDLGCVGLYDRDALATHIVTCTFALLAPAFDAQQKRLDEQERAQKQLNKKLQGFERKFQSFTDLLSPQDLPGVTSDGSVLERLYPTSAQPHHTIERPRWPSASTPPPSHRPRNSFDVSMLERVTNPPNDFFEPYHPSTPSAARIVNRGTYSTSNIPGPSIGLYGHPLHHLFSVQENLRLEITRVSTELQQLEGRQTMHALNESMTVRNDMSSLGAQLAGLSRQVQWLTSVQLQAQQQHQQQPHPRNIPTGSSPVTTNLASSARAGVGAAVSAVFPGTYQGGQHPAQSMRRGTSEEGRTKL